ncbi:MAG: hypothetical protein QF898_08080 [SAR202 cluster bacterium]|nr:hypothetical protein [SAR202 cluster bacterium]MDP6511897.1 hypothetical protein [SAR202 cluster bacterium]MDP6713506.1 hypothetical protein [SAR202 cluster bacterium]
MLNLKGCPRCNGDMYSDRDVYGRFIHCLQCGHYIHVREEPAIDHDALLKFLQDTGKAPGVKVEDSELVASAQ